MMKRCLAPLALVVWFCAPARAWNAYGHEVVASIAWDALSPATREHAVALLLAAPPDSDLPMLRPAAGTERERDRALFLAASHWADQVRDETRPERRAKYHQSPWHYVNFFWEERDGAARMRADLPIASVNVITQLEALSAVLADPARGDAERGLALAWVLHLVGDVHQPLHTSGRVTSTEPEGDRGGNDFLLGPPDQPWINLHAFWDDALSRAGKGRTSARFASTIARKHRRVSFEGRLEANFEHWARETFEIAMNQCYPSILLRGTPPRRAYHRMTRREAQEAAALAGYRLAALLEAKLGASP